MNIIVIIISSSKESISHSPETFARKRKVKKKKKCSFASTHLHQWICCENYTKWPCQAVIQTCTVKPTRSKWFVKCNAHTHTHTHTHTQIENRQHVGIFLARLTTFRQKSRKEPENIFIVNLGFVWQTSIFLMKIVTCMCLMTNC